MAKKKPQLVTVDPVVLTEAKRQCAEAGISLSHCVEELLRVFITIPGGKT